MKKIVSAFLALCLCLSVGAVLSSCGHEHTFQSEWSKDATHHWHACDGEDCEEIAEKAEHTWNAGEITTSATKASDGVKTFTCTVCGQTKTESVKLETTVTEAEWNAALALSNFTVVGFITERDEQEDLLWKSTDSAIYTENDGYISLVVKKDDGWHITREGVLMQRMEGVEASVSFMMRSFHLPEFTRFAYDEASQSYVYVKNATDSGFYQFNVYFENGVIVKIDGCEDAGAVTHSFTFTNYGTTTVDVPATLN